MQVYHSPISGKNLCNIFANTIVEKYKQESPDNFVEISVTSHTNFFVLNGIISSNSIFNLSEIFIKKINELYPDYSDNINVIDLINYGVKTKEVVNTSVDFYKGNDLFTPESDFNSSDLSQKLYSEDIHVNFTADTISNTIHYQALYKTQKQTIKERLESIFPNFYLEEIKDTRPNISDYYFGSWNLNKKYHIFLKYVFYNLSERGMCKGASLRCFSRERIDKLSWETIRFFGEYNNGLMKDEKINSMVLDLFDLNPENIDIKLKLDSYNAEREILFKSEPFPWLIRDKISEMLFI